MGVHPSTLYRHLTVGEKRDNGALTGLIVAYLRRTEGLVDWGELSETLYGEDSRRARQRCRSLMASLVKQGEVEHMGDGTWVYGS